MEKTHVLYGVIGLLAGLLIAGGSCMMNHHRGYKDEYKMKHSMSRTMEGMMQSLSGKTGDEFDKAFIKEMIVHHEGALAMAETAKVNAKHPEIKTMADAIITAQTSEITQMQTWLKAWYGEEPATSGNPIH